jgi:predicted RND superfamily exporter protein
MAFGVLLSISAYLAQKSVPFKIESLLDKNSPLRTSYLNHQNNFNDENIVVIAIKNEIGFSDREVERIGRFLVSGAKEIEGIRSFRFLTNSEYLNYSHRLLKLKPFFVDGQLTDEGVEVLESKLYRERFISKDRKVLLGSIFLNRNLEGKSETAAIDSFIGLANSLANTLSLKKGPEVFLIGHKLAKYYYLVEMLSNQKLVSPLIFLILSLLIAYLFKSLIIVVWVDLIIASSYCLVMMLIQLLDGGLSPYSGLSLTFVLIVATSDLIHFFSHFSEGSGALKNRLKATKDALWMPCFLTSLTTALSFLTLFFNDMAPVRSFGLFCSFGSICAFILTFYFLPAVMTAFPRSYPTIVTSYSWFIEKLLPFIKQKKRAISFCSLLFLLVLSALSTRVQVDDDFYDKFVEGHPLAKSVDFFNNELNYISTVDLVYPKLSYPIASQQLEKIYEFEAKLEKLSGVSKITSFTHLLDYLAQRSSALKQGTQELNGTLDFLKRMNILDEFFGKGDKGLKTTLYLEKSSIKEVSKVIEAVKASEVAGLSFDIRGFITVRSFLYEKIISNFIASFSLSFIAIFLIFLLLFKSLKWAALAIIPNMLPILSIAAFMAVLGVPIEGNAVMLICIIMGVAVDDTIHFLYFVKQAKGKGGSLEKSLTDAYRHTSKALIGTTLVFILSFPCFLLSDLKLMVQMGVFIIAGLILALFADFIILPALFLVSSKKEI